MRHGLEMESLKVNYVLFCISFTAKVLFILNSSSIEEGKDMFLCCGGSQGWFIVLLLMKQMRF